MREKKEDKKRGPKGGVKHTPGRDHDGKSAQQKKKRFARKSEKKRQQQEEEARKQWDEYDALGEELKRLLGPGAIPRLPRPNDD